MQTKAERVMTISTNAIRAFADKVKNSKGDINLTAQEARNLNHEISKLTAYILEIQNTQQVSQEPAELIMTGGKF
jgi:hypothetical protein